MKRGWFAVVFIVIAGLLCTWEIFSVKKYCEHFDRSLDTVKAAILKNDYEKAKELSEQLKNDWIEKEKKLNFFLEHTLLDDLSVEITGLTDYTDDLSKDEYLATADKIKRQLSSIYRSELPYGENIL